MRKFIGVLTACLVVTATITGCSKSTKNKEAVSTVGKTESTESTETKVGVEDATQVDGALVAESSNFDYSQVFDENGYIKGLKASEVVSDLFASKGFKVPKDTAAVTEEDVQEQIKSICTYYDIKNQIKDRAIQEGDLVNIDYVGTIDGVEFEGGNTEKEGTEVTAGSNEYIDDFLKQIVGYKPGETLDVVVTFPQDYAVEELAGKEAVFKTTINYIVELAELTDADVAKNLSFSNGWTTVKEAEDGIRENLKQSQINTYIKQYIVDFAKEHVEIDKLPKDYIEYYDKVSVAYFQDGANKAGMSFKDYLTTYMQVEDTTALLEKLKEGNDAETLNAVVIQAIAEKENLLVSDEDIQEYISDSANGTDAEGLDTYKDQFGLPYMKHIILQDKVVKYLYTNMSLE